MKSDLFKRLSLLAAVALLVFGFILLFSYDLVKINWNSFMKVQPAAQPMYDPLPVPADSIPIEGPAYLITLGAPANPIKADQTSIARGSELYHVICITCHGGQGKGDGPISNYLQKKPANLTGLAVQSLSDGGIFIVISNGVQGKMPSLNENLTVRERWDVVNFVRTLK